MKFKLLYLLTGAAVGAVIGSAVTWKYTKTKYEKIAQEEIDSVKSVFSKKENEVNSKLSEANKLLKENIKVKYSDITNIYKKPEEEPVNEKVPYEKDIYVIEPDQYGEIDDYELISLSWYDDDVLADDMDNEIDDYEYVVGLDFMNHFGEYEDDSVFVRNDTRKCDYEILRDKRKFSEVAAEDEEE